MSRRTQGLATVRSEGGLLPRDVLARIANRDRELGGLDEDAYHLPPSERLGEAIAGSWARLRAAWGVFSEQRASLDEGEAAGRLTRERWVLPLMAELGYGRLVQRPAVEIAGKAYAVFTEYQHSPVHIVGVGLSLDRRAAGERGAATQSPHSLVQELLNRSDERLWGMVTNGLVLRLLRDNVSLTRQAYVEFDLDAMFSTEAYEDFALLWLCAHQSRVEAEVPDDCWLERWAQAAQRDGTRALDQLRGGVERAIEALGRGFLAQPANAGLQQALADGTLDTQEYYRELLRLVYRLLFVFVAEDRDALLEPDDGSDERRRARTRYVDYYGTQRLRRLAVRRRGGRAHDLYEQLKLLAGWLHDGGQPLLAVPALGSALWDPATTPHLSSARLGNEALLTAVRELAWVEQGRRPVDFRNLGAEELGSVYESLLELHPEVDRTTASFALTTAAGHERKQTGSYYTPTSLINALLDTALDPVIERAARSDDPEAALLALTVCDPASGSGHFLIAAANRIAKRLAGVRERDPEPAPSAVRHAMRDVVSRCVYGVDVNPMAVELCKVSLWLEALEPGRPLSFLDDRILAGNSLFGTTPALVADGVPDDAFKPLLGDEKEVVKSWRQNNAKERKGQTTLRLDGADPAQDAALLAERVAQQQAIADDSLDGVRAREHAFDQLVASVEHERLQLAADTWLAAFTAPKVQGATRLTTAVVRRAADGGRDALSGEELAVVDAERDRYRPLHWHVAFPAVFRAGGDDVGEHGWSGGFDCVLGNPPWERVKLQEKEFFAATAPAIAEARNKAARERLIEALRDDDPALHASFVEAKRNAEGGSHLLRSSGRYPLCGRGDVNTYAVFAEGMRSIVAPTGRLGVIVPTGIATDDTTKHFFADMIGSGDLVSLYDFENAAPIFPGVHRSYKFCLLTVAGEARPEGSAAEFAFFLHQATDLADEERRFELTAEDIALLNPNTNTCPIFRTRRDAEITKGIYRRVPVLVREGDPEGNPWGIRFQRMFDMSNDSHLFHTREDLEEAGWTLDGNHFVRGDERMLPLYEAKMIHHFDHQWATYEGDSARLVTPEEKADPDFFVMPRYWVRKEEVDRELDGWPHNWLLGWRDICRSTDERTVIATAFPKAAVGNNLPIAEFDDPVTREEAAWLIAESSSFVHDYIARFKVGGTHLNFFITQQLPMLPPSVLELRATGTSQRLGEWVAERVDLVGLLLGPEHAEAVPDPMYVRVELDARFMSLYGVGRDDAAYILDTFPIVRRKDEEKYGEYRTKRLILEAYDRLAGELEEGRTEAVS